MNFTNMFEILVNFISSKTSSTYFVDEMKV